MQPLHNQLGQVRRIWHIPQRLGNAPDPPLNLHNGAQTEDDNVHMQGHSQAATYQIGQLDMTSWTIPMDDQSLWTTDTFIY